MTRIVGIAAGTSNNFDSGALQDIYNGTVTSHTAAKVVVDLGGSQTFTMIGTGFGNFNGQNIPTTGTVTAMIPPASGQWSGFSVAVSSLWTIFQNGDVDTFNSTFFSGNDVLIGHATAGNTDQFYGYGGNDIFNMVGASYGAHAILSGGDGNDVFQFAANLDPATNQIDGGAGTDTLVLNGNYSAGVAFGAATLVNVEKISLTAGNSYNLTTDDATVAAGQTLSVSGSALVGGNNLVFNGAAETNGNFVVTDGIGNDTITTGAGNDTLNMFGGGNDTANGGNGNDNFAFKGGLTPADRIDGGAGVDTVSFNSDYSAGVTFAAATMVNIETINLTAGYSYNLTTDDANVASGQTLKVNGAALGAGNVLTFNGAAETDGKFLIYDGAGNDVLTAGAGADTFNLHKGGNDIAHGGAGNDTFNVFDTLNPADQIDGGADSDTVVLSGNYSSGLVLGAATITNVETLMLKAGFSYNLTENNANVASGQTLTVNGSLLGASDAFTFNGAAETDGNFTIYDGAGNDVLTGGSGADTFILQKGGTDIVHGGAGNDIIYDYGTITPADQIDGGAGNDTLVLSGNYILSPAPFAPDITNVETLVFTAGNYILMEKDANVAAGQTLTLDNSLGFANAVTFDGTAERDGNFLFKCGLGFDYLTVGAEADTFLYTSASQSTGFPGDTIIGFNCNNDKFDLPNTITGIDPALTTGKLNQGLYFDTFLANDLNGHLLANHAELFTPNKGGLAGLTYLVVDLNGVAGYQAGEDIVIDMLSGVTGTLTTADFI